MTGYGKEAATKFAADLANYGVTVVPDLPWELMLRPKIHACRGRKNNRGLGIGT